MIEIVHQKQSFPNSCTSAALAMILGKTATEVEDEFHAAYKEGNADPFTYLRSKGAGLEVGRADGGGMLFGRLYLIAVPSLNLVASMHHIVVDLRNAEFRVYDPNMGREGKKYYVPPSNGELGEDQVELKAFVIDAEITHAPWLGIIND